MTPIPHPSPNYNERRLPVSIIVLHYTGMETGAAALERLCDPEAEVSAHYVVEEEGRILQLVDEHRRAWHAGASFWSGITDVNSASIGIEIVNGGHDFGLPAYPHPQIEAVIALCRAVQTRHAIAPLDITGHSDIAPDRKLDPGEQFPWQALAAGGVGVWPGAGNGDHTVLARTGQASPEIGGVQALLRRIGYRVAVDGVFGPRTEAAISAFQRRYRPARIDGILDAETSDLITRVRRHAR